MLLMGWIFNQKLHKSVTPPNRVASNGGVMVEMPEKASKIRILTDHEFEEMIQGYPLAIIQRGGQTHYLPLEP